jgi:hypothetical protein
MIPHEPPTELTLRSIGQTWDNLSNFIHQLNRLASTLNKGILVTGSRKPGTFSSHELSSPRHRVASLLSDQPRCRFEVIQYGDETANVISCYMIIRNNAAHDFQRLFAGIWMRDGRADKFKRKAPFSL